MTALIARIHERELITAKLRNLAQTELLAKWLRGRRVSITALPLMIILLMTSAAYAQAPVTLTVSKSGAGSGTVTSSPAGIDCGTTCSAAFATGTVVTLTATPAAGSTFTGWSGACTGTGTCTVTMNDNTTVTAAFMQQSFALTVSESGVGSGVVTSSPVGITCGSSCSATFVNGTVVTLTAAPDTGSAFRSWGGIPGCSSGPNCTFSLTADTAVTATFDGLGALDASWQTPTTNTDGTPLTNLASYKLYYVLSPSAPCLGSQFVFVPTTPCPAAGSIVQQHLSGLVFGALYNVAVTAINTFGVESACSAVVSATSRAETTPTSTTGVTAR